MSAWEQLKQKHQFFDLRNAPDLARHKHITATAHSPHDKSKISVHYVGDAVDNSTPTKEWNLIKSFAEQHCQLDRFVKGRIADGLQYHIAITKDRILWVRDLNLTLWSNNNWSANQMTINFVFILGGQQDATDAQWQMFSDACDALMADIPFMKTPRQTTCYGHQEWQGADTQCPGRLMLRLIPWRTPGEVRPIVKNAPVLSRRIYDITGYGVKVLNRPDHAANVMNVSGQRNDIFRINHTTSDLSVGMAIDVDFVTRGTLVPAQWGKAATDEWLHLRNGGYISSQFADLRLRRFVTRANVNIRSSPTADSPTVAVEPWGHTIPSGQGVRIAEEIAGTPPSAGASPIWLRLAHRTVYIHSSLAEERF